MKITLNTDISDIEPSEFTALPEGEYRVRCTKEPQVKSGNKADYIAWTFEIVNHPEHEGRQITHNTSISKKAIEIGTLDGLVAVLDALDIPYEVADGKTSFDTALATGQEAIVELSQRIVYKDGQGNVVNNPSEEEKKNLEENTYNDVDAIYPVE